MTVVARARWFAERDRFRGARARLAQFQGRLAPAALVILGLGGALGGGALIGEWALGVVLVAESALVVVVGLNRDDGEGPPPAGGWPKTHEQIMDEARWRS